MELALSNLQHQFTTCVAYFTTAKMCILGRKQDGDASALKVVQGAIDSVIELQLKTGEAINMTQDAVVSRTALELKEMADLMKGNCVNLSSLIARHGDRCREVIADPSKALDGYVAAQKRK